MDFVLAQDFPASLDRLWTVFGQPDYPQQKYLALGATAVRLRRFLVTADLIEVDLEREVPVDPARFTPWMRRLLGARQTLRHRTSWRRTDPTHVDAALDIDAASLPLRAQATGSVVQTAPERSRMTLAWRVTAAVPLAARRIEARFAAEIRAAMDADHAFTCEYLRHRTAG